MTTIATGDLGREFQLENRARGLRQATLDQYEWALTRMAAACPSYPRTAQDLMPVLGDPGLSLESRRDLLKCVRRICGWAAKRHGLPNAAADLDPLPRRKKVRRVLRPAELRRLMFAARNPRDQAMVLTILDTGIRVGELAAMRKHHLDPDGLVVDGKVGERLVPISPELVEMLQGLGDATHIWLGQRGPLTLSGIKEVFKRLFDTAGIAGSKRGAHTLRHTFGTEFIRNGGGVRHLQIIMGHENVSTTEIYVHLANSDVSQSHLENSPARRLGWIREPAPPEPDPIPESVKLLAEGEPTRIGVCRALATWGEGMLNLHDAVAIITPRQDLNPDGLDEATMTRRLRNFLSVSKGEFVRVDTDLYQWQDVEQAI